MIFGGQATNRFLDKSSDLDVIIIKDIGYPKSIQSLEIDGIKIDITIIPSINFDLFLLKEVYKENISAILHGLKVGRIVKDVNEQLHYYKDFASLLYDNIKQIKPYSPSRFVFLLQMSEKFILDYFKRDPALLESFILLNQIIDVIIDIELIFNLGWTTNGKTKARLLQVINPEVYISLSRIINIPEITQRKIALRVEVLEPHLTKYDEFLRNKKTIGITHNFFWDSKLAVRVSEKSVILKLCNLLKTKMYSSLNLYFLYNPFYNSHFHHILIIKGEYSLLEAKILPILRKERLDTLLVQASEFPLTEIFNGGKCVFEASEAFYSYLCGEIINKNANERGILNEVDDSIVFISILFSYSMMYNESQEDLISFFTYLFDCWSGYAYNGHEISYDEIDYSKKKNADILNSLFLSQKDEMKVILDNITHYFSDNVCREEWQDKLIANLKELHRAVTNSNRYVPEFELKLLSSYTKTTESDFWYICRKQFETVFYIFEINEKNWGYFSYICKETLVSV